MEDCGAAYRTAPEHIKRAYNQALFEKILVRPNSEGSCEVWAQFAAPYGLIFGQEARSGAEAKEAKAGPAFWRGSGLFDWLEKWRNHRIFLCDGFNKDILVENSGIEPLTS